MEGWLRLERRRCDVARLWHSVVAASASRPSSCNGYRLGTFFESRFGGIFGEKHANRVISTLRTLIGLVRVAHSGLITHPGRRGKHSHVGPVHVYALPPKMGPALPDPRGSAIKFSKQVS